MSKSAYSLVYRWPRRISLVLATMLFGAILISANAGTTLLAQEAVVFTKTFTPDTIGPGSTSTLQFDITNWSGGPVTDLAFTDNLPEPVEIAVPAQASTTCTDGSLSAPDGGTTISLSGARLAAGEACIVTVNVTSSSLGTHTNTSGDLTSSAGNHGSATDDLTVDTDLLGFTKSFAPGSVSLGGRSTLTFVIDNSASTSEALSLAFVDNLPTGVEIADPANVSNTCAYGNYTGGTVTAVPGTSTVSLFSSTGVDSAAVNEGSTCTVVVDVIGTGVGMLANTSEDLISAPPEGSLRSSGKASAILEVTVDTLSLIKSFTDDPVPPGGIATLEFTINNFDRSNAATNIAFTDDLNATLPNLAAVGLPMANPCGTGSQLTGTNVIALSGGNLPPGGSCTFSTTLQVPSGAATGAYTNTTSSITANIGGSGETGSPASDKLFVAPVPILTKSFDDPVAAGDTVTLTFTISNTSSSSSATGIAFEDVFPAVLPTAASVPAPGFCGDGATATFIPLGIYDPPRFTVSDASLTPGASCSFDLVLNVAAGAPGGIYPNVTSLVTAMVDGETVIGKPATDNLEIVAAPEFRKSFADDPVLPGDTVTLEFTLMHPPYAPGDATNISFTDDLTFISGLAAVGLPVSDVCGTGSQISGTTNLSFSGGSLAPGASCTFNVTLQVPPSASPGTYNNTTSNIVATVSGLTATGNAASDDLKVAGLSLTKEFIDDPVIPGGTATLRFTLDNQSTTDDATSIYFSDNLGDVLPGLVAVAPLPPSPCGGSISGTSFLIFTGGSVPSGNSCSFDVTVQVPAGAADGIYNNATSNVSANMGGSTIGSDPATDDLTVNSTFLQLAKSFIDDPVAPGDPVTLEFTIENLHTTQGVTDITFTDDLSATLSGLVATGLPVSDVCGPGSQIAGTDMLTLTGGNLGAGASCTFQVTVQVPAGAAFGTYNNTTSEITGTITGLGVRGEPATDDLQVASLTFTKTFDDPTVAGGTVALEFTIENNSTSASVGNISFSDDLDAVVSGLVATSLPPDDSCGEGSRFLGTSVISMSNGVLGPGASCTFSVTLQVPVSTAPGSFLNTTSNLLSSGSPVSDPATDTLTIEAPPGFSKNFAPDSIGLGGNSTLVFTIDNTASSLAASNLDFTDNLPAGVVVATPPNASTTCSGGTLTAVADSGTVSYSGGTVAAGATCTVQTDVTGTSVGVHVNTTDDLTSSSGNSGPATDTLTVEYMDFGDAPDPSYPTLFTNTGASHVLGSSVYLGNCVDAEADGQPTSGADGDDANIGSPTYGTCRRTSDEDGVVFLTPLHADAPAEIRVTASAACTLTAWIDFDADGDWADTGEDLFPGGQALAVGTNDLAIMVPAGAVAGDTYARFRCTTDGAVTFTERASDGEVEDYQVTILPPVRDFGDAPDPNYPTLLASTGASHKLENGVYLGVCVDAETDGQPTPGANGDDVSIGSPTLGSCVGNDDEDGVIFTSALLPNEATDIEVVASTTCTLSAWIDYNANGDWSDAGESLFSGGQTIGPGSNILSVSVPAGATEGDTHARFRCTTDGAVSFTGEASDGEVEDYQVKIGAALDLGDAPDPSYPTLLASTGASHVLGSNVYLGSCVDAETNGQPSPGADGDDANASSPVFGTCREGGDEDGVIFTSLLVTGQTADIQVTASAACTLTAWIDFNADGDWADAGEGLFPGGQALVAGTNNLAFAVPTGATVGDTYARFRCTTDGAATFTGQASDGEVEDYQVRVGALDLGDAPDPTYPTRLASTGATHLIGSDVYLGSCVDAEADGQPTPGADGDDVGVAPVVVGTCVNGDDEDGVAFTSILIGGQMADVEVTANSTCTLSAWIDFDADGDWADAGENLFPGGQTLVPGVNSLNFAIPAGATRGNTYARFRCTTDGAVTFTGEASDGEVEDHRVRIGSALDLGDAPDPDYPTLLGSIGASHVLGSGVYLGSCVDAEVDGQPTSGADGDDANAGGLVFGTCQGGDDEDGVTFLGTLFGGETADIEVTASADCTLSGWIDLNGDGDWADTGEDLFPGGELLTAGINSLTVAIPITAKAGDSYARFRCTTSGVVMPTGPAPDGEVEDYQVAIHRFTYLPLIMHKYVVAPDLVVENIIATSDAITVVIRNIGEAPVTDEFWVDAYIDPDHIPTAVNQIWPDLGDEGATWSIIVTALPLAPGETLTLTIGDAYYTSEYSDIDWPLAAGTQVYVQVDSWDGSTTYGAVEEAHEIVGGAYNNISGPVLAATGLTILPSPGMGSMPGDLPRVSNSLRYTGRKYQWK